MAANRPVHSDIWGDGILGDAGFVLDWHNLYASAAGTPGAAAASLPLDGPVELSLPQHAAAQLISADSLVADPGPAASLAADLPPDVSHDFLSTVEGPLGDSYWRPSYVVGEGAVETATGAAALPADPAPDSGLLPRAEAVMWSGPALMVFPGDVQEASADVATADVSDAPDPVTRADLDPILSAHGSGAPVPADAGALDLGAAFHSPGEGDSPHLADSGMLFAPPPLPPPPDLI